jgi:hypothetical protein
MAKLSLVKGTTSYRAYIFIQDSSVTTGAGLTGLVFNSGSLVASYVRPGAARQAITLITQTVTGAYASGGFVEVDSSNMPGLYRVDIPDAALATGVDAVVIMLKGAANMVPVVLEVELTAVNNQNATTGGLTNLDATVSSRSTYAGGAVASVTAAVTVGANNDKSGYALSGAGVSAVQLGLSTVTAAQVNAEVVDALNVDTYAEPSAVPVATASLAAKIGWLMALARNKLTQTSATQTLRNNGDSSDIATAAVSDDGTTFTRNGWV